MTNKVPRLAWVQAAPNCSTRKTAGGIGDVQSLKQSSLRCGTRLVDIADPSRSKRLAMGAACTRASRRAVSVIGLERPTPKIEGAL